MANQLLRNAVRVAPKLSSRAICTSSPRMSELTAEQRDKFYPKLGDRDIVGYGWNGAPTYMDRQDFPAPAIRFGTNTDEVKALREKEKGDWSKLSMEEKKTLYRASFCQTYAEMSAPTGEWKSLIAGTLFAMAITGWVMIWIKNCVYLGLPSTITEEWKEKQTEHMIRQGQSPIEGISSKWDYEKNTWK